MDESTTRILRDLQSLYSERLGYPAQILEESADLEAELGVDSIEQFELAKVAVARYSIDDDELSPGDYTTLGRLRDFIARHGTA